MGSVRAENVRVAWYRKGLAVACVSAQLCERVFATRSLRATSSSLRLLTTTKSFSTSTKQRQRQIALETIRRRGRRHKGKSIEHADHASLESAVQHTSTNCRAVEAVEAYLAGERTLRRQNLCKLTKILADLAA